MADTLTAPAPSGTPGAPASPTNPSNPAPSASSAITDAGASLRSAASWEDLNFPSMDVTDGDADVASGTIDENAPDPVVPAPESVPAVDEGAEAAVGTEFVQDADGKWHRPDGTFATVDEIAQITAQLAADAQPDPAAETNADNIVTLRTRDGKTREVVIDDPDLAQEIRQNFNDGMRKKEFLEKSAALEADRVRLQQIDALLEKNPESVVYHSLNADQKVRLATMLLAEHFDALVPIIQSFDQNPGTRIAETADAQKRMRDQQDEFTVFAQAQAQARDVRVAVAALIPDTTDDGIAEQFYRDASNDLQHAIARGEAVNPSTVSQLLAQRMKLYGFAAGASPASSKPRITAVVPAASPSGSPVAQPVGAKAQTLAETKHQQNRIRLTQRDRRNAAAVPPVGAGAAPVRLPAVPKGASIEDASRELKKQRSWTS